ncbi:hypothetical protein QAD02_018807 [Eretmocerus hayati]|uniref:Uncharacterized protein n=1 Tax=Eretmocerus hayati TaxID=131215 RepID=A0ACC2PHV8_9HYME|nr:hypothetical protein QAD02_018807 [Eretmocerus hayati]
MKLQIVSLIFLALLVKYTISTRESEENTVDHLLDFVYKNFSSYKANVMVKSFGELSNFASSILRKTNQDVPSSNYEIDKMSAEEIEKMEEIHISVRDPFYDTQYLADSVMRVSERMSLTIAIFEPGYESNILHDMIFFLKAFIAFNPLTRGKYLIHLITDENVDFERFFQKAWTWNFLDLVVIQWLRKKQMKRIKNNSTSVDDHDYLIHSFNPFNNTLIREQALTSYTELFPDKLKDLKGYPLVVGTGQGNQPRVEAGERWSAFDFEPQLADLQFRLESELARKDPWIVFGNDPGVDLIRTLFEVLNCSLRGQVDARSDDTWQSIRPENGKYGRRDYDFIVPKLSFVFIFSSIRKWEWERRMKHYLNEIQYPIPNIYHLYLMRPKTYEQQISIAAIVAFAGLFFTAFVFAVWAQLIGFKIKSWSFLNILTAQMSGSIEHRGPMKLSEMIFQMSIYVATFIVVTLGSDYMYQIFVLRQNLPLIETIEDLAQSDVKLVMIETDYDHFRAFPKDHTLKALFERIQCVPHYELFSNLQHSFCRQPWSNFSTFNESINLCVLNAKKVEYLMQSNEEIRVDKIRDPVATISPIIYSGAEAPALFRFRTEELLNRFMQVGLLNKWEKDYSRNQSKKKGSSQSARKEIFKDKEVPMQNQLWPVLAMGFGAGVIALIGELLWKSLIEKTEFGKFMRTFHRALRPTPPKFTQTSHNAAAATIIEIKKRQTTWITFGVSLYYVTTPFLL